MICNGYFVNWVLAFGESAIGRGIIEQAREERCLTKR
jgi:hypothetical protein